MDACILCNEELGTTGVAAVGEKGRKTLVAASSKRSDGLEEALQSTSPSKVHISSHKDYTRENTIIAAVKKKSDSNVTQNDENPNLRSAHGTFDIKQDCIFCSESETSNSKSALKRRKTASNVETIEFRKQY